MQYLSQRAFAALPEIGVSHVRINKLVKDGRLPINEKGQIPRDAGIDAFINGRTVGFEAAAVAGAKFGGKQKEKDFSDDEPDDDAEPTIKGSMSERFNIAKTLEKEIAVEQKRLALAVEKREFIHVDTVQMEAQQLATAIRQKLISIAPIIGATAEGKTAAQIQRIVELELNNALEDLQKMGK